MYIHTYTQWLNNHADDSDNNSSNNSNNNSNNNNFILYFCRSIGSRTDFRDQ